MSQIIEVEINVQCEACGNDLSTEYNERRKELNVTPCKGCMATASEDGYNKGYEVGHLEGVEEGIESAGEGQK